METTKKNYNTIADLNDRTDLVLVTEPEEVCSTLDIAGIYPKKGRLYNNHSLFVKEENGDIIEVYVFEGSIPYLNKSIEKLK